MLGWFGTNSDKSPITILSADARTVQLQLFLRARVLRIGRVVERGPDRYGVFFSVRITMGCQLTRPRYLFFESPLLEPNSPSPSTSLLSGIFWSFLFCPRSSARPFSLFLCLFRPKQDCPPLSCTYHPATNMACIYKHSVITPGSSNESNKGSQGALRYTRCR